MDILSVFFSLVNMQCEICTTNWRQRNSKEIWIINALKHVQQTTHDLNWFLRWVASSICMLKPLWLVALCIMQFVYSVFDLRSWNCSKRDTWTETENPKPTRDRHYCFRYGCLNQISSDQSECLRTLQNDWDHTIRLPNYVIRASNCLWKRCLHKNVQSFDHNYLVRLKCARIVRNKWPLFSQNCRFFFIHSFLSQRSWAILVWVNRIIGAAVLTLECYSKEIGQF